MAIGTSTDVPGDVVVDDERGEPDVLGPRLGRSGLRLRSELATPARAADDHDGDDDFELPRQLERLRGGEGHVGIAAHTVSPGLIRHQIHRHS